MLDLFSSRPVAHVTAISDPAFPYLRTAYRREVTDIINYYQQRVYAVKNNHLLARILYALSIPMQYETLQYASVAETRAAYVASSFRLTSELTAGRVFDGVFYGPGCPEVILHRECYFDPLRATQHWKHLAAVQVHRHPQSHTGLLLPNGKTTCTEQGIAVLSVNIALLAVQYRGFVLEQYRQQQNGATSLLGINHFIHMYVLPNMLYRHVDYLLLNRVLNLYYGAPMGQATLKHPFLIYDYNQKLDRSLSVYLTQLKKRNLTLTDTLMSLPAVYAEQQRAALQLPDYAPTRQVEWALVLSRLPVIQLLVDLSLSHTGRRDRDDFNALRRLLTRLLRDQSLLGHLPAGLDMELQIQLQGLLRQISA